MELKDYLLEYKKITIHMIENIKNKNYDDLDHLIKERQATIDNIMSMSYLKEDFKHICDEILLLKYENELIEIMKNEKQTMREKINNVQKNKNAYKTYNSRFLKNSYFLKKKV